MIRPSSTGQDKYRQSRFANAPEECGRPGGRDARGVGESDAKVTGYRIKVTGSEQRVEFPAAKRLAISRESRGFRTGRLSR